MSYGLLAVVLALSARSLDLNPEAVFLTPCWKMSKVLEMGQMKLILISKS